MEEKKFISRNLIHGDNHHYYIPIVVSFLFIYLAPLFSKLALPPETGIIGAGGWVLFHVLRFRKKLTPSRRDYLKLALALFYGLSLLELYLNNGFDGLVVVFSGFSLFTLYSIDRIILNNMKKLSVVLVIVLMLISVFFVVFAQIQKNEAEKQTTIALKLAEEASALQDIAIQEANGARQAEAKALLALEEAEQARQELLECQGNN